MFYLFILLLIPFKSFTSYLTRLAECNKLKSYSALAAICFPNQSPSTFRVLKDYPPLSFEFVQNATTCSEEALRRTTFYYVSDNLGRSTDLKTFSAFLSGSIARFLRYCPLCLTEQSYYRLPWRFLILNGCCKHTCLLLSVCVHCGYSIPVFSPLLKIGLCPNCKGDLRKCCARTLTELERQDSLNTQEFLEFLLSPHEWKSFYLNRSIALGRKFSAVRKEKQLLLAGVSQSMGISTRSIQVVELGEF